jgi:hypothetical protein
MQKNFNPVSMTKEGLAAIRLAGLKWTANCAYW